jgi:hypothetical protein
MNLGRGLFRAWVFVSVIWICTLGFIAYTQILRQIASPIWSYVYRLRGDVDFDKIPNKPLYEIARSPSAEKSKPEFHQVEYQYVSQWSSEVRNGKTTAVDMPDGSHLYLDSRMNKEDQNYLAKEFWDQRWWRWLEATQYWALAIFGVPVTLFVLGWGLLWVGRGFPDRNKHNASSAGRGA